MTVPSGKAGESMAFCVDVCIKDWQGIKIGDARGCAMSPLSDSKGEIAEGQTVYALVKFPADQATAMAAALGGLPGMWEALGVAGPCAGLQIDCGNVVSTLQNATRRPVLAGCGSCGGTGWA